MTSQTLGLKSIFGAIVCGILASLATGLVEIGPEIGLPEYKYYGYPLVWRVTKTLQPTEYRFTNLAIDAIFWIAISFLVLIILKIALPKLRISVNYKALLLPLILFIPLGLVMDFVHEFGHALWGILAGGRLTNMKIAFFKIYPRFAITSQFVLGYVSVEGLAGAKYGLFLLGGSLTTNVVAWFLALILWKMMLGYKTQVALKVLGLFGILDLPFYVIFPQIGFQHWIFLGGYEPEPLLGARNIGIPDPVFYIIIVLTTLGLFSFYFKPLAEKAWEKAKTLLGAVWPKCARSN